MANNKTIKRVGVFYHPQLTAAQEFASELERLLLRSDVSAWTKSAWADHDDPKTVEDRDLLISVGGDGTILRVAHLALEGEIPILGINMGKVGFMSELSPNEAKSKLPEILAGLGRLERRTTLQAHISSPTSNNSDAKKASPFFALNDVVVARGKVARVIRIEARIDGDLFTTYKGDGVIVASATGSTSYCMAAGGPILNPQSNDFILNPVTSHLTISNPLVLPPSTSVDLTVSTDHEVIMSVDGQIESNLLDGDQVSITVSPKTCYFLRLQPAGRFYSTVTQRLTRME